MQNMYITAFAISPPKNPIAIHTFFSSNYNRLYKTDPKWYNCLQFWQYEQGYLRLNL